MKELRGFDRQRAEDHLIRAGRLADDRRPILDLSSALPPDAFQQGYRLYDYTEHWRGDPIILISPDGKSVQEWNRFIPTLGDVDDALALDKSPSPGLD